MLDTSYSVINVYQNKKKDPDRGREFLPYVTHPLFAFRIKRKTPTGDENPLYLLCNVKELLANKKKDPDRGREWLIVLSTNFLSPE